MNNVQEHAAARAFVESSGITMKAEFVPQSKSRNAGEKSPSINWGVTITNGRVSLTTDYMQGIAHLPHYQHRFANKLFYDEAVRDACETGRSRLIPGNVAVGPSVLIPKLQPPSLDDVLYSLVLDADVINYATFEEWANEFGYDPDSRAAEAIYRSCLEIALKLRQLIDLDAAREAFQEY
jgi:hypothetical protein